MSAFMHNAFLDFDFVELRFAAVLLLPRTLVCLKKSEEYKFRSKNEIFMVSKYAVKKERWDRKSTEP